MRPGFSVLADYSKSSEAPASEMKLSAFLHAVDPDRFPTLSSSRKTVRKGLVHVNGQVGKVHHLVMSGRDSVLVMGRTESSFKPYGEPPFHGLQIDVLYEDDVFACVYKPPGYCRCAMAAYRHDSVTSSPCQSPTRGPDARSSRQEHARVRTSLRVDSPAGHAELTVRSLIDVAQ
eukprot:748812-Hanusia_phi.AAC.2